MSIKQSFPNTFRIWSEFSGKSAPILNGFINVGKIIVVFILIDNIAEGTYIVKCGHICKDQITNNGKCCTCNQSDIKCFVCLQRDE